MVGVLAELVLANPKMLDTKRVKPPTLTDGKLRVEALPKEDGLVDTGGATKGTRSPNVLLLL